MSKFVLKVIDLKSLSHLKNMPGSSSNETTRILPGRQLESGGALVERAFPRPRDEAVASMADNEPNHIACTALMCGKGRFHGAER
jgi:hypothetical protein